MLCPCLLFAQQTYPSGTAFEENFGNATTNPQACWSGGTGTAAQCNQLWAVSAGSGQEIVTAPTGWSGNALELPSGSTALNLKAYGTMPLIPASTGFTLTFTVELSSYPTSYTELIRLKQYTTGNIETQVQAYTGGFEFYNGTTCGAAAGSTHTIVVVINGSSSLGEIDGTQCGNKWSDPGYPVGEIEVGGGTSYNTYIQQITINGARVTGQWPPSFYANFNGQYGNTVSTSTLQAGTVCNFNALSATQTGAWSQSSTTGITWSYVQGGQPFANLLGACGGGYGGNVNVALEMTVPTSASPGGYWENTFYTNYSMASVGFYAELVPTGTFGSGENIDFLLLGGSSDQYNVMYQSNSGGTEFYICFENQQGGGTAPCSRAISASTFYWITFDVTGPGGTNNVWIYNINANGGVTSLFQELTEAGTHQAFGAGTFRIGVGKVGDETISNSANVIYSNIIVSAANAPAPLMPPVLAAMPMMVSKLLTVRWASVWAKKEEPLSV
jgi:hypothetical protein